MRSFKQAELAMVQVHHVAGRLRMTLPQLKDQRKLAAQVERSLAALDGVSLVQANVFTGSVTLHYDRHRLECDRLYAAIRRVVSGLGIADPPAPPPARMTTRGGMDGSAVVDKLVDQLIEKCVERAALALLGVLL